MTKAAWNRNNVGLAVLAGLTLVGALLGLAGLSGLNSPIRFSSEHDKRAFALLERSRSKADLDRAAAEVDRALALSPYNNSARLRLTYIDAARRGALGPVGLKHLETSYDLVAFDYSVAQWRIRFALEHWRELTPELRRQVEAEALAFGRVGRQEALHPIQDPEGRLAAALWWRALGRKPRSNELSQSSR